MCGLIDSQSRLALVCANELVSGNFKIKVHPALFLFDGICLAGNVAKGLSREASAAHTLFVLRGFHPDLVRARHGAGGESEGLQKVKAK